MQKQQYKKIQRKLIQITVSKKYTFGKIGVKKQIDKYF